MARGEGRNEKWYEMVRMEVRGGGVAERREGGVGTGGARTWKGWDGRERVSKLTCCLTSKLRPKTHSVNCVRCEIAPRLTVHKSARRN